MEAAGDARHISLPSSNRGLVEATSPASSLLISLPLPPVEITPNGRVIWQVRMGIVKRCRRLAERRGINARIAAQLESPLRPLVQADLLFVFKTSRRHDEDNLVGGLKPYFDGLVDAHVLLDDAADQLHVASIRTSVGEPRLLIRLMGGGELSPLAQKLIADIEHA